MTVKEAINWLSTFPENTPVMINYGEGSIMVTTWQYVEDGCPVFDVS